MLLLLEKFFLSGIIKKLPGVIRHLYGLAVIMFGWTIFSAGSTYELGTVISSGLGGYGTAFFDSGSAYYLTSDLVLIIICILCSTPLISGLFKMVYKGPGKAGQIVGIICYALMFTASAAYLVNATYNPFLYFRF